MAALLGRSVGGLGVLGLVLLTGCGGHARPRADDPTGAGGSLSSDGGTFPSASGSSASGTSGTAGGLAAPAGNGGEGALAHAGFPGSAGSSGSAASDAGAGGGGVVDVGPAAKAACASTCSKFNSADCQTVDQPSGNLGATCQSDCERLFAVQDGACTDLGLELMSCLTQTTPEDSFSDCGSRFRGVTLLCSPQVNGYEECIASVGAGPLPATLCSRGSQVGTGDPTTLTRAHCFEATECLNGVNYKLDCIDQQSQPSLCFCSVRDRPTENFSWPDSTIHACKDAYPTCRALAGASPAP